MLCSRLLPRQTRHPLQKNWLCHLSTSSRFQESECGEYSHLPVLEQGWLHKEQFWQVSPLLCHLPWQPPSLPVLRGSSFISLQEECQFQQLNHPCIACCIVYCVVCNNCSYSYIVFLPASTAKLQRCCVLKQSSRSRLQ